MATRSEKPQTDLIAALRDDPLAEAHRRLVPIHYALSAALDADPDVRGWSVQKLMDLIDDIQAARGRSGSSD